MKIGKNRNKIKPDFVFYIFIKIKELIMKYSIDKSLWS